MISLREIDRTNWEECIELKVSKDQEHHIAPNIYSIAEVQFIAGFKIKAIYWSDVMIGFVMYGVDPDDKNYWIYRFMIDERYQGNGYGKSAMNLLINEIQHSENRTEYLMIGYKPDNEGARRMYKNVGFEEIELAPWGEIVARYKLV